MRPAALALAILPSVALLASCPSTPPSQPPYDAGPLPDGSIMHPCSLPGAVQFTANGVVTVPGGAPDAPSLSFLTLPVGFCAHYYGTVGNARQIRFAPGGELFVASPTMGTTGGGQGGLNAIMVLPDDNQDGVADASLTFLGNLSSTQGLLFANGAFYYQDQTRILRLPYKPGDRKAAGPGEQVVEVSIYTSGLHWPKALDMSDDGHIYVGNGGDQGEACVEPHPFHGGILEIDGSAGGNPIVRGLRNPIAVRCARGHNRCFALELALDYSAGQGGREKLIPIQAGDDWGFPCCATQNLPYTGVTTTGGTTPNCSAVDAEGNGFLIGDTPFGVDFEPGRWPAPWAGRAYVVTHGAAGSWAGARLVGIPMDATTGLPTPSTDVNGTNQGLNDFATGWDDGTLTHGRPAAVTFAPDGRLFVANDNTGVIFWIAAM
jgi:glucose/arabinose dehydrogenase